MKWIVVAFLLITSPAYAHHVRHETITQTSEVPLISAMERFIGTNPTGWSHQWCARFLNQALGSVGLPTSRSNAAISFIGYGQPTYAHPGAIAVMRHHVGVVTRVLNGAVELVSGNHGHKVGIGVYPERKIIAYRMP